MTASIRATVYHDGHGPSRSCHHDDQAVRLGIVRPGPGPIVSLRRQSNSHPVMVTVLPQAPPPASDVDRRGRRSADRTLRRQFESAAGDTDSTGTPVTVTDA